MTEYKSYRFIDGKARWVIVNENGNIINRNPSKEELKGIELEIYIADYRPNRCKKEVCDRCGEKLKIGKALREYNIEGNWTFRWVCKNCYEKYDPNSYHNIIKSMANRRIGNLDPNSEHAKGDNFEELTSLWKGVKILSKENDKYCGPLDHSIDSKGKRPETKGRFYNSTYKWWNFAPLDSDWNKEFDYEICYCVSEDGNVIERIYEIPKKEIIGRRCIGIYKSPMNSHNTSIIIPWYDKYRVIDEETIKIVNDIWNKIIIDKTIRKV